LHSEVVYQLIGGFDGVFIDVWQVLWALALEIRPECHYLFFLLFSLLLDVFSFLPFEVQDLLTHLEDEGLCVIPFVLQTVDLLLPRLYVAA